MIHFMFYQDVKEKKKAASGARHRASRGKKAVSVKTPADLLDGRTRAGRAYKGASECRVYRVDPVTGELVLVRIE
jgi:hypothetical protein